MLGVFEATTANSILNDVDEIFSLRDQKAHSAMQAVADVVSRRRPLNGLENGFLDTWRWINSNVESSTGIYRDPRFYHWSQLAFSLLGSHLGTAELTPSVERYIRAIGGTNVSNALAIHLEQFKAFALGAAWEIDTSLEFELPLLVRLPWAMPGSPWSLGGTDGCAIRGIEGRNRLLVSTPRGDHALPFLDDGNHSSDAVTLCLAPQIKFESGCLTLQPHAVNLPGLDELNSISSIGTSYQWQELSNLQRTLESMSRIAPQTFNAFAKQMRNVILKPEVEGSVYNTSCSRLTGLAIVTSYRSPLVLAEDLIHEFCHNYLFALEDQGPLFEDGEFDAVHDECFYSPWRKDSRPLYGLFHAYVVFTQVADFWNAALCRSDISSPDREFGECRLATLVKQLAVTGDQISRFARLTELGQKTFDAISNQLRQLEISAQQVGASLDCRSIEPLFDGSYKTSLDANGDSISVRDSLKRHIALYDCLQRCANMQAIF
ncbi:MAG: HEXXH motif-containing putative peptide modification protein [Pirellulaceae bacterium]|nr:HEXXH motif-containing putative peptide modification protein [Pirellulaceae bacterium]